MRTLFILLSFCMLSLGASAQLPSETNGTYDAYIPGQGNREATKRDRKKPSVEWETIVEMDDRLYPSYVWAVHVCDYLGKEGDPGANSDPNLDYHGDSEGQIGITIKNNKRGEVKVKLVVEAPEIMRRSEHSCVVKSGRSTEIFPQIDYLFDVIGNNEQVKPVLLKFTLYVNGKDEYKKTHRITLRSIYECPFQFYHKRSEVVLDQSFMFSAYVNENHPKIANEILPELMDTKIVDAITGYLNYGSGINEGRISVIRQVFAVWQVLRNRGIQYSTITGSQTSDYVASQYVRTFEQSLSSAQANCVDGTVLMASILYRMGIEPLIVIVPGHAYLGFYLDRGNQNGERTKVFIETTMLAQAYEQTDLTDDEVEFANAFASDIMLTNYRDSYISFVKAAGYATQQFNNHAREFNRNGSDYKYFEVDAHRKAGVNPLNR